MQRGWWCRGVAGWGVGARRRKKEETRNERILSFAVKLEQGDEGPNLEC